MKATKQCFECKQQFRREELVDYAGINAKTMHSYCPKCLKEKQARDKFAEKVCMIFGIKTPGPRIWTERKRLINTYGYTDNIIIDCLDYIYNVEHKKKISESLFLIQPPMVEKMRKWKKENEYKTNQLMRAMAPEMKEYIIPVKENNEIQNNFINADDFLEEE